MTRIERLRVEHYATALGIGTPSPRLSWTVGDAPDNWSQGAYEIEVSKSGQPHEAYSTKSNDSVLVPWPSVPLRSRETAQVRVRVQGTSEDWTPWVEITIETGLLRPEDWAAVPISNPPSSTDVTKPPFRLRKVFTVPEASHSRVRLYVTAYGLYEAYLNGQKIGEDIFAPGWTSYYARLPYQTYDLTNLVRPGENVFGAWIGEGWYAGNLGYHGGKRNIYGERIGLLAQLEIDGEIVAKTGEEGWEWSFGAILSSEIYHGEMYNATLPDTDFEQGDWHPAELLPAPSVPLVSSQSPPVRVVDTIKPKQIITTPSGKTIVDFGQNFGGLIRFLSDPSCADGEIVIRHAEVLEHDELGSRPIRYAKATETITLGTRSLVGYMPRFTFHGFRYAEITGWKGLELSDIEGVVLQSSMTRAGDFRCSHPLISRLHENCVWSTMANTISIPSDCPQRDERLGWTGDICVYAPTMSYLFDTSGFLSEWLVDLAHDQQRLDGIVPIFSPDTGTDVSTPEAIWGDAAVLTPYDLYTAHADVGVLETQYASVVSWLKDGVRRGRTGLWSKDQDQLGDWLAPKAPPETPNMGPTDNHLVADAWLIHSTKSASKIARAIGRGAEADAYQAEAQRLTDAFYAEYVTASGRLVSETQTALCLLLAYDIFPSQKYLNGSSKPNPAQYIRQLFAERLVNLVRKANWLVDTGFAGTPIVLQTLAQTGNIAHAYRMLQARECPSWLSCVLLGATTIWERWDSMLSDGTINPGEMTSFNHYALGSVASFMHNHIGGLTPLEPGWKRVSVKPQPGGTVTWAKTSHQSPYGKVSVSWEIAQEEIVVQIEVPPNTTAEVVLPGWEAGRSETVGSGKHSFRSKYVLPDFPPKVYTPHFAPIRPNEWVL
ncbi:bacterial alpha-L-rhamnosidase-domain-containing protein [Papiliotrema laurentii]|uniref:alpha-L-rhamnosidase n=1 Tax=Papiliotrema laurentii TaxID=5418 RepID=A0AAD9FSI5_PAPLA|nr:bacterial alpha-L-rhamnosidase-domain-containing protein [Papiliotrema laurentii]